MCYTFQLFIAKETLPRYVITDMRMNSTATLMVTLSTHTLQFTVEFHSIYQSKMLNPIARIINREAFLQFIHQLDVILKTAVAQALEASHFNSSAATVSWKAFQVSRCMDSEIDPRTSLLALQKNTFSGYFSALQAADKNSLTSAQSIHNFFIQLYDILESKLKYQAEHGKKHCMICYDRLALQQEFKFISCEKALCRFQAEEIGLGGVPLVQFADHPHVLP